MSYSDRLHRALAGSGVKTKQPNPLQRLASPMPKLVLALLAFFCLLLVPIYGNAPLFVEREDFGTGLDVTRSVAVGDVDGDGDLDLVTGNDGGQNQIYLNDGVGSFDWSGSSRSFGSGTDDTWSVAVGDVDGDGDLDIVSGNERETNSIYFNDGQGVFDNARSFGSGVDDTLSVAVGDVDGDGDLDIAAGNYGQQNVVYLNDGTGRFDWSDSAQAFGPGDNTMSVVVGDVDGDDDLDLISGNDGPGGEVNVVYFNNNGVLTNSLTYTLGGATATDRTQSIAVGDMNGDGALDLVIGNESEQNRVYLNDGTGQFNASRDFGPGSDDTYSVAVGDVDGDGDLDIVTGNFDEQDVVYFNDGTGQFDTSRNFGTGEDRTFCVLVADLNGDGHLDIISANTLEQNAVFLNDGSGHFPDTPGQDFGTGVDATTSVAVGDVNRDGTLDLITGNGNAEQNAVYLNDGVGGYGSSNNFGTANNTASVAVGDMDGDGALDIVTGNDGQQNAVYLNRNDGTGEVDWTGSHRYFGTGLDATQSVAVGDMNGDGHLDLIAGNDGEPNAVYLNNGTGDPDCFAWDGTDRYFGTESDATQSVVVGDMNGDGHLDLIVGNDAEPNAVYLNDQTGHFGSARIFGSGEDHTYGLAVGDVDGDGDLDIVSANYGQQNAVYLNDGTAHLDSARDFGTGDDPSHSVAVGDMDGDGDLDIVVGNDAEQNAVYLNDGAGHFSISSRRSFGPGNDATHSVALGDVDRDGDLDIVTGNNGGQNEVYLNHTASTIRLANSPPLVAITRPGPTGDADFYSTPVILQEQFIPITYTLSDLEGDPVGYIGTYYSLDGGGNWYTATAANGTPLANLATGPHPTTTLTNTHVFTWDTFASGVFGQSDNAVFRIEAYPQPVHRDITNTYRYSNTIPGAFQRPYATATSFPFRLRGTQVRVVSGTTPGFNALVYRLTQEQSTGATPLADGAGRPYRTDLLGYLQGRSAIAISDTLVALLPITATDSYSLYFTNAAPTPTGMQAFTVRALGVQTLTVTSAHPLVLFNLDVSLEWDARNDEQFLQQLEFDLQRTSELLYDWTNGQAALGQVAVYHNRERWQQAHIRVYATNRMRPSATQGGIVSQVVTDPLASTLTYIPGQVRIGAVWNRYGDSTGILGEDWPRTLAHEIGHYGLYLNDNYLGLDENGLLIPVDSCPGAMSDPYRDDDTSGYDEFHHGDGWDADCADTLSALSTGRWDWATIPTFYPWLDGNVLNPGPNGLPLGVTEITVVDPVTPTMTLETPIFYLTQDGGRVLPDRNTRAYLFQGNRLTDLGRPTLDHVLARGARPGDRLCVYELAVSRLGCETIQAGDAQITLANVSDWQPEVILTPITSRTVVISVTNAPAGLSLNARFFPAHSPAPDAISLTPLMLGTVSLGVYTGTFTLEQPALEGAVHVWVEEDEPRREIVTDYALGGNLGRLWPTYGGLWPRYGRLWPTYAPAVSIDSQVILFADNLKFELGEFYVLQAATTIPSPPSWATVVGQGYRLSTSANAPDLSGTSISFNYLGNEVPPGEESWLRVYYWDGTSWAKLLTKLDTYHNLASAPTQGEGLYVLMSSLEIPLYQEGWNLFSYPVPGERPVAEALNSIQGIYSTVYGYEVTDATDPWKVYGAGAPDWVNDLEQLSFGLGYWINVTAPITLQLQGTNASLAAASSLPIPPATFYGTVQPSGDFTPTFRMLVTALVNEKLCGQAHTQEIGGQIVYAIDVLANDAGEAAGCGTPGQPVNFKIGSVLLAPSATWDNSQVWERPLRPFNPAIYLPLVRRD